MNPRKKVRSSLPAPLYMAGAALFFLGTTTLFAAADPFAPLFIPLQPSATQPTPPSWETGTISIVPASDAVLIPVPALASQDDIGCFALTVVFQDPGDGGPVVEWQPKEGQSVLLSAGLGETGLALGLNARTILITQSLALDGGTLRVSYAGRFSRLISATLRPARELSVAALGSEFTPALLGTNEPTLSAEEVSGADQVSAGGDSTEGQVVHAELTTEPKQLDAAGAEGGTEFIIPLSTTPQGSLLQTDIAGLDPESQIEVSVNGEALGALGAAPFSLNAPSTLFSASGRLALAGWHPASLLIPARLWKTGDNSVVLTLHRVAGDEGHPVYLKKARADLLFAPHPAATPLPTATPAPEPTTPATTAPTAPTAPITAPTPTSSETLSTGSAFGNPSPSLFHAALPDSLQ